MSRSQTAQDRACPACGESNVDPSFDDFDGLCTTCGFVIDGLNPTVPERLRSDESTEEATQENWLSVCRVRNATEQQLAQAFATIERIADWLDLPIGTREATADMYCNAFRVQATDGRETTSLVAACVRLASIQAGRPVPTGRLTALDGVESSQFRQSDSALRQKLDLALQAPRATDYVEFIAGAIDLPETEERAVRQLLEDAQGLSVLVGKDPAGIAASAAYVVSDDYTQATIAEAAGISTETIRLRASQLREVTEDA